MKTILKKLTLYIATIVKLIFPAHGKAATVKEVWRKPDTTVYSSIKTLLKQHPEFPATRKDAKLLHRRLAQYQRLGWRASREQKEIALLRLQKEWKKALRNKMRNVECRISNFEMKNKKI